MEKLLFINARAVLPDRVVDNATIEVTDGKITAVDCRENIPTENARIIDVKHNLLLAGFVDTHIHGGGGADFMDLTQESFRQVVKTHALHGTTSICPTAVTSSLDKMGALIDLYRDMSKQALCATLLGIHLEGPFLSTMQSGAQSKERIIQPTKQNVDYLLEKGADVIKRIGIAPEVEGAIEAGRRFAEHGILVSVAHSNATFDIVQRATENGFSHVTHLFCATPALRKINEVVRAGIPEAAYLLDDMSYELIGDGLHIPAQTIEIGAKIKAIGKVSLVTDAMRAAGQDDVTESYLGEMLPENRVIVEGGVAKLPDRSSFAGSIATSEQVFKNVCNNTRLSLPVISAMMSLAPAISVGADKSKGSIEKGKDADLVIADTASYSVLRVFSLGREIV